MNMAIPNIRTSMPSMNVTFLPVLYSHIHEDLFSIFFGISLTELDTISEYAVPCMRMDFPFRHD